MKSKCAFLFIAALHACAPIPGDREVGSSSELFRLRVGDTAHVDLASIEKEAGVQVWRPERMESVDIMGMRNHSIIESLLNDSSRNQVYVIRWERRGSEDCCVLRMKGAQGQATVVKFLK
jgi:hypothetical protein